MSSERGCCKKEDSEKDPALQWKAIIVLSVDWNEMNGGRWDRESMSRLSSRCTGNKYFKICSTLKT